MEKRLTIVTGNYGSGKTEFSVNYIKLLAQNGGARLVDLDIVNPYFRSREATEELEALGIDVIAPRGAMKHADLPIILPEVKGAIEGAGKKVLLDIGGDPEGARVLKSFAPSFQRLTEEYDFLFVLNAYRPFTDEQHGALKMLAAIEESSGLTATGIISNAHLIDETTPDTIEQGLEVALQVSEKKGIPVRMVVVHERFREHFGDKIGETPVFYIRRILLPPWKKDDDVGPQNFTLKNRNLGQKK